MPESFNRHAWSSIKQTNLSNWLLWNVKRLSATAIGNRFPSQALFIERCGLSASLNGELWDSNVLYVNSVCTIEGLLECCQTERKTGWKAFLAVVRPGHQSGSTLSLKSAQWMIAIRLEQLDCVIIEFWASLVNVYQPNHEHSQWQSFFGWSGVIDWNRLMI